MISRSGSLSILPTARAPICQAPWPAGKVASVVMAARTPPDHKMATESKARIGVFAPILGTALTLAQHARSASGYYGLEGRRVSGSRRGGKGGFELGTSHKIKQQGGKNHAADGGNNGGGPGQGGSSGGADVRGGQRVAASVPSEGKTSQAEDKVEAAPGHGKGAAPVFAGKEADASEKLD